MSTLSIAPSRGRASPSLVAVSARGMSATTPPPIYPRPLALRDQPFEPEHPVADVLSAPQWQQMKQFMQQGVERGELLPSHSFCEALGLTRQAVSKAVQQHRMFFLEWGGLRYYPGFFCDPHLQRQALEEVSKALGSLPGGAKWQFFTTARLSLGQLSPLQVLQKGRLQDAVSAAQAFLEE